MEEKNTLFVTYIIAQTDLCEKFWYVLYVYLFVRFLKIFLTFHRSCKLVWAQIAEDSKLSQDVFDILLEMGSEQPVRMLPTGEFVQFSILIRI